MDSQFLFFSNTIKNKIIFTTIVVISVFGSFAATFTYLDTKNNIGSIKKEDLIIGVETQAKETAHLFTQSKHLVETIANQEDVISLLSDPTEGDISHVVEHGLLYDYNIGDQYSAIYLMDRTGLTITSTDKSFEGQNYNFRDYFQSAIEGAPATEVAVGVTSGELGYYFAHPVKTANGKVVGVAVVKLKPEIVNASLDAKGDGNSWMLVDPNGVVTYSTDSRNQYKSVGKLPAVKQQKITRQKLYADKIVESLGYDQIMEYLPNYKDPKSFVINEKLITIAQLPSSNFFILNESSFGDANALARREGWIMALLVLVAAASASMILSWLINSILKPLSILTDEARAVAAEGKFDPVNIKTGDEIEDLAEAFNKMTTQLLESRKITEAEVGRRTAELETLNKAMVDRELKMMEMKKKLKEAGIKG